MIVCPACGCHNPQAADSCSACGASLVNYEYIACPICGAHNKAHDLYCLRCLTLLHTESEIDPTPVSADKVAPSEAPLDPLAELKQVLPPAKVDFSPPLAGIPLFEADALAVEQIRLLATGAATPDSMRKVKPEIVPAPSRFVYWVLIISILLAALIPSIMHISAPIKVRARDSVSRLAQTIASLPEGAVVLVSFDYGPTYAGELDPLAQAILTQLRQRSARLLIMSTLPTGMGSAERVLASVPAQTGASSYGQGYVFLGYLAGEESGLRLLTSGFSAAFITDYLNQQDINTYQLVKSAPNLAQVERVIVLTEDANTVRRWVEQVQSRVPIALDAAVSASAEPSLVPYYLSNQLSNLVAGLPAAVEYTALSSGQVGNWGYTLSYAGLWLVLILVAIGANIAQLVQSKPRRS